MGEGIPGNDMTVVNFWQRFREGTESNQTIWINIVDVQGKFAQINIDELYTPFGSVGILHGIVLLLVYFGGGGGGLTWRFKVPAAANRLEELGFMGLSGGVWIVIGVWVLLTLTQVILIKLLPEAIALCAKAEEEDQKSVWKYPVAVWIVDKL